jgi:hypothetical protein
MHDPPPGIFDRSLIQMGCATTSPLSHLAADTVALSEPAPFASLLVRAAIADEVDALERRDDLFGVGHDDDGRGVLQGHLFAAASTFSATRIASAQITTTA